MKIVIIGGSSFSTPSLVKFLDSNKDADGIDLVLASRSLNRLEAVARACRLLVQGNIRITTDVAEAANWRRILDNADVVMIQPRVGGFEGRLFDETFPHKYGLSGDEGLGLGGLSAGWRTWPLVVPILDAIATFCPQAFVIFLTAPLSLLVRASLQHTDLNLVGICELPWTTLQELSRFLGVAIREVQADYVGVNHLGWFFKVRFNGRDLLGELAQKEWPFPTNKFLQAQSCLPTRYLRMHYQPDAVLTEQMSEKSPRAEILSELQQRSYQKYASGDSSEIASALEARHTPWYSQAVGPLLLAQGGRPTEIPFFLSVRNGAHLSFLAPDDVIECRHQWINGQLQRSPFNGPYPKHVIDTLIPFVEFERVATDAVMRRSVPLLREALARHPWTRDHTETASMAEEIVTANNAMLTAVAG